MPTTLTRRLRAFALATAALVAAGVVYAAPAQADTAPKNGDVETFSTDVLSTVQMDGIAWTTLIVGNTVYVGGSFNNARPAGAAAGTQLTPRRNVLAFNLQTGALIPGFVANTNAQVNSLAASPDGSRIYIGGNFTQVNGVTRNRIAAVNPTTGALITSFAPSFNASVETVVADGTNVYAGGNFTAVGGTARTRVAKVAASNGALQAMNVTADLRVLALALSPDGQKLVLGGNFTNLSGSDRPGYGFGAVNTTTGAVVPWNINNEVRQAGNDGTRSAAIYSLKSDATGVYGTAYMYPVSGRTLEGAFRADWANGDIGWLQTCKGDSYDVGVNASTVYVAGHAHDCSTIAGGFNDGMQVEPKIYYRGMAWSKNATSDVVLSGEFAGNPTPALLSWFPEFTPGNVSGSSQAAWATSANDQYVVFAGEFPRVNNVPQQGIVRFAAKTIAPNDDGPRITGANFVPTLTGDGPGSVQVRWLTNWDRDNQYLTYELLRGTGTATPATVVYRAEQGSRAVFDRPVMSFTDTGLTPGTNYGYRVRVTDPWGNSVTGNTVSVTAPSAANSAYLQTVLGDSPSNLWRLGETSGTRFVDSVGGYPATIGSGVTLNQAGAIGSDANRAATFPGTLAGVAATSVIPTTSQFAQEAWFRTTSTTGGHILSLGNNATISTGTPASRTLRALTIDGSGKLSFGVTGGFGAGATTLSTSQTGFNDGQWHHVVGQVGPSGAQLYVDGQLAGQNATLVSVPANYGYWHIGGDAAQAAGGPTFLAATIDDAAVYPAPLTAAQVQEHYTTSGRTVGAAPNLAPTAAFTSTASGLTINADASTSTDSDGTITAYSWNWGDNTAPTTGATSSHTYAAAGTYTVTLTVTDNQGATGTRTATVRPSGTAGNAPPVPSFTATPAGLVVNTDASASTDSDGSITTYGWNWGDGGFPEPATSSPTSSHTYPASGTFTITLTATDNAGATATTTRSVTVTSGTTANTPPTASFTATLSGSVVSVNGSASTDSDGSITAYAWNWGDGSPAGSGVNATHTYGAGGNYTITLTVTDNRAATATTTRTVTVAATPPPGNTLATDAFGRSVTGGFGTADTGGAWTLLSGASSFSVANGTGNVVTPAGASRYAALAGVSSTRTDTKVTATVTVPVSGTQYIGVLGRVVGSSSAYRAQVRALSDGSVTLLLIAQETGTVSRTLSTVTVPGLTVATGDQVEVRLQVVGTNPTTLNARVWKTGTTEPTSWHATATDSFAGLQTAGGVGLFSYLSTSASPTSVTARFDNLTVTAVP